MCRTAATPSPRTGSSCGGWGLGPCWSSWSGGSPAHCPTETVRTTAHTATTTSQRSDFMSVLIKSVLVRTWTKGFYLYFINGSVVSRTPPVCTRTCGRPGFSEDDHDPESRLHLFSLLCHTGYIKMDSNTVIFFIF